MNTVREVPVDVLPPVPRDAELPASRPPLANVKTFYHPASGVIILGLDILLFGPDLLFGVFALPVTCALAFLVTLPLVYLVQTKWSGDNSTTAFGKAFLGAFMAGLPFSIAGTIYGAAIIALSGLPHHPLEMAKRIFNRQSLVNRD
jgi:hypothetical protein